jgi:hypothetical protein
MALAAYDREDVNKGGGKMQTEQLSQQLHSGHNVRRMSMPAAALPDVNFETYPFELVQHPASHHMTLTTGSASTADMAWLSGALCTALTRRCSRPLLVGGQRSARR